MGPHLGYGDVICDRACSVSFRRELESMRCSAALAVAGAAGGGGMCGGALWWAAVDCGISGTGSGFPVGWRTAGRV